MRYFHKLAEGLEFGPIVHAITRQPELWNQHNLRTTYPGTPHRDADDILLWFNDLSDPQAVVNDRDVIPYPGWTALPQVRTLVFDLMRRVEGVQLGRTMITRLAPGNCIYPHKDEGAPAQFYSRYQVALQSLPGCLFMAGDETIHMATGSIHYFDNSVEHSVVNHSADDRLALIVDIRNG